MGEVVEVGPEAKHKLNDRVVGPFTIICGVVLIPLQLPIPFGVPSTLVASDTVGLIKSALDDQKYRWLKEAGAVAQLWEASMMLVTTLENTFLPMEHWTGRLNQISRPETAGEHATTLPFFGCGRRGSRSRLTGRPVPRPTSPAGCNGIITSRT